MIEYSETIFCYIISWKENNSTWQSGNSCTCLMPYFLAILVLLRGERYFSLH
jgi:hypothetical protein